ncbi:MAG TPA: T9SS type A sorting domain-containing protein, partial [Bacteroidota bacterium]
YGSAMDVYNNTIWCAEYYGSGKRPFILKSTDAGVTWTDFPIALPGGEVNDYYLRSINFKDANTGMGVIRQVGASTTANYLVKTTDGGATWSDTISVAPGISHDSAKVMAAKWIRGTSTVIATGYAGNWPKAWKSTDDGTTWTSLDCPPTVSGADLKCSAFIGTTGFFVGNKAAFMMTNVTAVDKPGYNVPAGYSLEQNYPNPFNPSTTIPYTLAKAGNVQIKVVDLLGRTVATLVDGHQSAGPHTVSFNATTLSSGVYFYSIKSGEFSKTKSLLLLK